MRDDLLGAHVSTAGGAARAPARGRAIGATAIQVFTKSPNQWREPVLGAEEAAAYRLEAATQGIRTAISHDSYLINLASQDKRLRARSMACFKGELRRAAQLGLSHVVTHPGHFMRDRMAGLKRSASGYAECLSSVRGPGILIETTAGSGTVLGARFEELAELLRQIPPRVRARVGFCMDTCHVFAAGYDLVDHWDRVWSEWDRAVGRRHLRCMHLNDSKAPLGSRRDRHELIGEGMLGAGPFRRIMRDPRFARVIKIIETPKGDDPERQDRRMLRRLRAFGRVPTCS